MLRLVQRESNTHRIDVYPTGFHAFDMLLPFRKISREAIRRFEEEYLYAAEHYIKPQKK